MHPAYRLRSEASPMTDRTSETPELPPFPDCDTGPNAPRTLERWGIKYQGPREPHCVRMDDGYWTPWHIAERELAQACTELERWRQDAQGAQSRWHIACEQL